MFPWLLLPILPVLSQHLEIIDLKNNPGVLAIKNGRVYIKTGNDLLLQTFELETFDNVLGQYNSLIIQLGSNKNSKEMFEILKLKYEQTLTTLKRLLPKQKSESKQKRAINVLGSIIKAITGNLDNNDLINLNDYIRKLELSNENIIIENNKQVKINYQIQERLNNLTKMVQKESKDLARLTNQLGTNFNIQVTWEQVLQIQRIIFNLDIIQKHLDTIFESIQLAKMGIIAMDIIHPEEFQIIKRKLETQGIVLVSDDQVYEYLEAAAYYNGSSIVFVIKIPRFLDELYEQVIIENLPLNGEIVLLNASYAVLGRKSTFIMNEACNHVEGNIICDLHKITNVTSNKCIHTLLRGNPSYCPFQKYSRVNEITTIEKNNILIKNAIVPIRLENNCGYGPKNITGTFLIIYNNCSIRINNMTFEKLQFNVEHAIEILPLQSVKINKSKTVLTDTQYLEELHIENRNKIENIHSSNQFQNVTMWTNLTWIVILIAFSTYLTVQIRRIWKKIIIKPSNVHVNTSTISSSKSSEVIPTLC